MITERFLILAATAMTAVTVSPAYAQQAAEPQDEAEQGEEITVTGQRERGSVPGDIQPEQVLRAGDIRAYGVSSITDLLAELAPQLGSGRGREGGQPVVLLNGRRISGLREIRDLPTEAIERAEVLPPEAAQQLGYRADQRVLNIVLRRRFRAWTGEAQGGGSTAGARYTGAGDANLVRIALDKRLNVNLHYDAATAIYEADRDVTSTSANQAFPGAAAAYRTLSPATQKVSGNATYSRPILGNVTAALNLNVEATESDAALGLSANGLALPGGDGFFGGARGRSVQTNTGHAGLALNGDVSDWRWSFTGNYDRNFSSTFTDPSIALAAQDYAQSVSNVGSFETVVNGPLFELPAGPARASVKTGFEYSDFDARTIRTGTSSSSDLGRNTGSGQVRLDLPIASRNRGVLAPLGNLSLNGNYAYDQVSDFGLLSTWGYGLNWSPIKQLSLLGTVSREDTAPTTAQLGNPLIVTPDARVFDFVQAASVLVAQIDGGNPLLLAEQRRITNLTANLTPLKNIDLNLTVEYTRSRTLNPIATLPAPTAALEAAFPDRFTRDANGQLTGFDNRPVNFAQSDFEQVRWGFNFTRRVGPAPPPGRFAGLGGGGEQRPRADGGAPPAGGAGGGQGGGGQGGGGQGGGGQGGGLARGLGGGGGGAGVGRLQLSVFHTWRMKDTILIRAGLPELDLLNGDATSTRGGSSEHRVEFNAGLTKGGYGVRLSGNWQSGTFVNGGTAAAPNDLNFAPLTTVTLRTFADFNRAMAVVREHPWLEGARLQLTVGNVFNNRLQVTDAAGVVPVNYQPDLLDPVGRSVTLSLRKLFFTRPQPGQRR